MFSTVVGSLPVELEEPSNFKDKLLNTFGLYDPYKQAIKNAVIKQLDAGVDIVSDGQVRGDMVSSFTKYIPGMKLDNDNTVIYSKIKEPIQEISINDLKYAKSVIEEYYKGNVPENKGVKGIITGPSTIVFSSRIESFYKNKKDAILDLAHSLKHEVIAIEENVNPKYIQIDEPFLSTGLVDFKVAKEAIRIISKSTNVPIAMHVCGNLENCFNKLATFDVDILDFEFAGNDVNLDILKNNVDLIKNKKIGFGCINTASQDVDSYDEVKNLISQGIEILGEDNIILDPDCGLRRATPEVAFKKLKLMNKIEKEFS